MTEYKDLYGSEYFGEKGTYGVEGYPQEWIGIAPITYALNQILEPASVLDLGCANGIFLKSWEQISSIKKTFGVEISQNIIDKKICRSEIVCQNVLDGLAFEDNSFDLVTVFDLGEHILKEDQNKFWDEIFRVTKKWVVALIATVDNGEVVRPSLAEADLAGHVFVKSPDYWYRYFLNRKEVKLDIHKSIKFFNLTDILLSGGLPLDNWKFLVFLEKVKKC